MISAMFIEGTEVYYKNHYGIVDFVCEQSLSILVRRGKHRSQDVCIVVHRSQFNEIRLVKESEK
jgi:hypothetical protein